MNIGKLQQSEAATGLNIANLLSSLWNWSSNYVLIAPEEPIEDEVDALLYNVNETSKLLHATLADLNDDTSALDPAAHFKHLNAFLPSLRYVDDAIKTIIQERSLPLSPKEWQLSNVQRDLYAEMAKGYRIIAHSLLSNKITLSNVNLLCQAVNGAMESLGNVVLVSCRCYRTPPPGVWRNLHQLYLFAEKNIQPMARRNERLRAYWDYCDRLYKSVLLLWLANPHSLSSKELDELVQTIEDLAKYCQLFRGSAWADNNYLLATDLTSDNPPSFRTPKHRTNPAVLRIIDTNVLRTILTRQCLPIENEEIDATSTSRSTLLPYRTLALAFTNWETPLSRKAERASATHPVKIAFGLAATHFFLIHPQGIEQQRPHPDVRQNAPLPYIAADGFLVNESAGGICIVTKQLQVRHLCVGELLGIFTQRAGHPMLRQIAVVRWINTIDEETITFGAEILTTVPIAVATRTNNPSEHSAYTGSILVPQRTTDRQPAMLITKNTTYRVGDFVTLHHKGKEKRLLLTAIQGETQRINQFAFALLGGVNTHPRHTAKNTSKTWHSA